MKLLETYHVLSEIQVWTDKIPPEELYTMSVIVLKTGGKPQKFVNFKEAKKRFPSLDIFKSGDEFTSAMKDGKGMRFEDWEIYDMLSR